MPIRLLRYLIVSLCIPFAVVASEIDYRQIQKDLNSMGYNVGIADGIPGLNTSNGIQNFLNDAGYTMPSEITDNEQDFIQNIAFFASKPLNFMREIITAQLEVRDLTDQQLCELNLHLDLVDSFYEIQRRGINCPSGTEIVIRYEGQLLHDPIELLRSFQRQHQITIPSFDLTASRTFYNWDETKQNYLFLNPNFEDLLGHDAQRVSYCSDWMPQVGSIPTDPSKNLDGTGAWANDTLRDGFVICQDSLNMLYLEALSSDKLLSQESTDNFQNIVETWMETDRGNNLPFRPYHPEYNSRAGRAGPNFTYLITISKLMAGVELLKSQFQWSSEQQNKYAQWSRNRVLQMLPVSGRTYILRDSICDLNVNKDNMNNACMNAAPYIAQGLLRAAIAGNDTELAELSYLVFKQYSSAIRPDGSQAYDSIRDCYAADYTVWAAEFLHDYVYLASTAGVNLWEDQFSSMHGSPRENVEYALEVRRNPDVVNDYAQDFGFTDCQENDGQIVQRVVNKPAASFAYYLYTFTPEKINEIYLEARSNLFSYTGASGVNYEVDLINTNSELKELLSDGSAHGTRQKIETIKWYIALRDDDYKAVLEGKDIISIAPNFQIIDASYEDVTKEGIQGREALVYQFTEDFIHIEGTVTLVGNERVYVNFKERIEVGQAEIIFGPLDKLIISWKD